MGLGEFFALSSAFVWALAVVLFRRTNNVLPPFETNLFKIVLGFVLVWPTLLLVEGWAIPDFSWTEVGISILSGYLGIAVADTWYLRSLHLVGASRIGIISSLLSPFVILLSVLFLGESLNIWQMGGPHKGASLQDLFHHHHAHGHQENRGHAVGHALSQFMDIDLFPVGLPRHQQQAQHDQGKTAQLPDIQ